MGSTSTASYFRFLAFLAVLLLWGISLLNGTVKALLLAVWHGGMGRGGVVLKTDYTGFPPLDYPIALLVAFFFYGTNGYDEGYQLFLLDAYTVLQPAFVWLYVETLRPGNKSKWIRRPVIFGLLWQCFGGAISLPLFYAVHSEWIGRAKVTRANHLEKARFLPLAFVLGAVVPAVIGLAPTWLGPGARSAKTHQIILAAWQLDPVWVSWILQGTAYAGTWILGRSADIPDDRRKAYWWVRFSYLLAAVSSASGHLYVVGRIISSYSHAVNIVRLYMPFFLTGPTGTESNIFARGPWLFLQYDFIIISLSSLSWAVLLLRQTALGQRFPCGILELIVLIGTVIIGPGATVSLALLFCEIQLPEYYQVSRGSHGKF